MENKIKISENEYRAIKKDGKNFEYYIKSQCTGCKKEFLKRKYKKNEFCSKECYYLFLDKNSLVTVLSEEDLEIVNGSLLSDGCIPLGKSYKNLYFEHVCKFEEYIDFITTKLDNFLTDNIDKENKDNEIILNLKTIFRNFVVIASKLFSNKFCLQKS
jgi:hypothetical protein